MAVNKDNAKALRGAMATLLAMAPQDGMHTLTWNNVCAAAGVPRPTAARATDLIAEWKVSVESLRNQAGLTKKSGKSEAPVEKEVRDTETIRVLRDTVRMMANHIQALTLAMAKKDILLAALEAERGAGKIVVLGERGK